MRLFFVLACGALALAACTNQALGPSTGKPFALNPGYWTPANTDLAVHGDDDQ